MRGFPTILISIVSAFLLVQAVSGMTISVTQMPALYVTDYGAGIAHTINNYNLSPTVAVSNGTWMLLATNDQATFARIDARKDVTFSAGQTRRYDVGNSASYRWYYLYLQDGFPVGSNLDFHLNELSPPPSPTSRTINSVEIVIEKVPLVVITDFGKKTMILHYYTFTSSETLPATQSWQVFGTNDAKMLGSNDPGLFTLLDNRSGIGFVSGVPQQYNVTTSLEFQYYVIYLQSGFSVRGMTLGLQFHLSENVPTPTPTPTPTVTPTPIPTPPPVADFDGNPRAGYTPLQVTFTDKSTGTILNWSWKFGDGSTSSEQNPAHTYLGTGWFHVNLTVCNDGGCSWFNRTNYIFTVAPAPTQTTTPVYYIRISGGSDGYTEVNPTIVPSLTPSSTPTPSPTTTGSPAPEETKGPVTGAPTQAQSTPTPTPTTGISPITMAIGILAAIALLARKCH